MDEFVLEDQIVNVVNPVTKQYLREVISSYNSGNYRSSVLVLYTTIIYDLLHKLTILKDVYDDNEASNILENIKIKQKGNPKDSNWETKLIEEIHNKTRLIDSVEKEQLLNLKEERNYAAHPIIDFNSEKLELKSINKETSRDLIRKGFEIVFLKDAILGKNIADEVVYDLKTYYERANTQGLKSFLKAKYFNRMIQKRKDHLFKSLWKIVFIVDDINCDKNREANYWGLYYLYQENKDHYKNLLKENENFYFMKLNIETFKANNENNSTINDFLNNRIATLIKFIEYNNDIFSVFNEHAKNIIKVTVNNMFSSENILEKPLYEIVRNEDDKETILVEQQIKITAEAVFLSSRISKHFENINKMITNYCHNHKNWTEKYNYIILADDTILNKIFVQCEYRGCIKEFVEFLIEYSIKANTFDQAQILFRYIEVYSVYFSEENFYRFLAGMNYNNQYYKNPEINNMLKFLENKYEDKFNYKLIRFEEDKFLYRELYKIGDSIVINKYNEILDIVEERSLDYDISMLMNDILRPFISIIVSNSLKPTKKSSKFPNILSILTKYKDYTEEFKQIFKDEENQGCM